MLYILFILPLITNIIKLESKAIKEREDYLEQLEDDEGAAYQAAPGLLVFRALWLSFT